MEGQPGFTEIKRTPAQIVLIALKVMLLPLLLSALLLLPANAIKLYPELVDTSAEFNLVRILAHDSDCFTEGLQYNSKGQLVQSCGPIPVASHLKFYDDKLTGFQKKFQDRDYFYEGITFLNGSMYLLTYQNQTILRFAEEGRGDAPTPFKVKGSRELWGAASNGTHILVSNGTARLLVYSSELEMVGYVTIKHANGTTWNKKTNQLEYDPDTDLFYANSWFDTRMIVFNQQGVIQRIIELESLLQLEKAQSTVRSIQKCLNGIAVKKGQILITGKLFSNAFIITLA